MKKRKKTKSLRININQQPGECLAFIMKKTPVRVLINFKLDFLNTFILYFKDLKI